MCFVNYHNHTQKTLFDAIKMGADSDSGGKFAGLREFFRDSREGRTREKVCVNNSERSFSFIVSRTTPPHPEVGCRSELSLNPLAVVKRPNKHKFPSNPKSLIFPSRF